MITKEQALTTREFCHNDACTRIVGPRGGVTIKREIWRRNGQTQTWKTRPGEFRIPVKFGLKTYGYITEREANQFHRTEDCPNGNG